MLLLSKKFGHYETIIANSPTASARPQCFLHCACRISDPLFLEHKNIFLIGSCPLLVSGAKGEALNLNISVINIFDRFLPCLFLQNARDFFKKICHLQHFKKYFEPPPLVPPSDVMHFTLGTNIWMRPKYFLMLVTISSEERPHWSIGLCMFGHIKSITPHSQFCFDPHWEAVRRMAERNRFI